MIIKSSSFAQSAPWARTALAVLVGSLMAASPGLAQEPAAKEEPRRTWLGLTAGLPVPVVGHKGPLYLICEFTGQLANLLQCDEYTPAFLAIPPDARYTRRTQGALVSDLKKGLTASGVSCSLRWRHLAAPPPRRARTTDTT